MWLSYSRVGLSLFFAVVLPGTLIPTRAAAQNRRPVPANVDVSAQEARLQALEDRIREMGKRADDAEARAQIINRQLAEARAELRATAETIQSHEEARKKEEALRRQKEDEARNAAVRKKDAEEAARARDYGPARTALAFADFSWIPGNYGPPDKPLSIGPFSGEFRVDTAYHYSFNRPKDDTISGSSEVFRHNELQLTQLGIGGDFYYKGAHARIMTQFGMYSQTTPRNDASTGRGQWNLDNAYRYLSEAYAGYHIDKLYGINIQAGIFMSYVGLWSYYNFDNWTYQPSYVSSNTPWFFNGVRVQFFPTKHLKIEPWLVNGWQSYGKFNEAPGVGLQVVWRPNGAVSMVSNDYYGSDTLGTPGRKRIHSDNSFMVKYHDKPGEFLDKAAASFTVDAGCEWGGEGAANTTCLSQYFLGFMAYTRLWFAHDKLGLTVGGGAIRNPGRYLVLLPPINGATAFSGTPYFSAAPGDPFDAWDMQITGDYMPTPYTTFRLEFNHRAASIPYFSGRGGVTPPGGNQGAPGSTVAAWAPDLVKSENRLTAAFLLRL